MTAMNTTPTADRTAEAQTKNKRADRVKVGDVSNKGNVVSKVRDDAGYIVITFENGNSIMTYADDPVSIRTTVEAHRRNVARRKGWHVVNGTPVGCPHLNPGVCTPCRKVWNGA